MASRAFVSGLRDHLANKPKLNARDKRAQKVLDMEPGPRRTRILNRMEDGARHVLGDPAGAIDWLGFDFEKWEAFIAFIMKILALFGL